MSAKPKLLLFTSLYPYPWMPTRAVFNFQQYRALEERFEITYLVPIPFLAYFRHLLTLLRESARSSRPISYFPMFYVPGYLRRLNPLFLAISALICITPAFALWRAERVMASWAYPDAVACSILSRITSIRFFVQCLGSDVNVHRNVPARRRQLEHCFKRAEAVITVSRDLASKVREIAPGARAVTIYNGVDFERFRPVEKPSYGTDLMFIGNLIRTKGVFELLEGFAMLSQSDSTLHLIGDGPDRGAMEAQAKALKINDRVVFHGRVPHNEVAELLPHFALLVLPSYSEGVPNVVVEALAAGVPVAASRVGGIPEVLSDTTGVLMDGHSPIVIKEAIQTLLQRPRAAEALRASVTHLTWQQNADAVTSLLTEPHA